MASTTEKLQDEWKKSRLFTMARECVEAGGIDQALELAFVSGVQSGVRAAAEAQNEGFAIADAIAKAMEPQP